MEIKKGEQFAPSGALIEKGGRRIQPSNSGIGTVAIYGKKPCG